MVDQTDNPALAAARLEKGDVMRLLDKAVMKKKILPAMLEKALALAEERKNEITQVATAIMNAHLQEEIERLEDLRAINDHVRPDEIAAAKEQKTALKSALETARIRLDAVRLILRSP